MTLPDYQSIPELAAASASAFSEREAIVDGSTTLTYAALHDAARDCAAALVAAGIERGERVGIWAANSARWVVSAFGLWQAGCVLVPVNTRFKGQEAAEILRRSAARAIFTMTDFLGVDHLAMLRQSGVGLPDLATTVVIGGDVPEGAVGWEDFVSQASAPTRAEADRRSAALQASDPSDILFTSGTTGVPKGVVQTHGRTLRVATDWVAMTGLEAGDRYLMVNPYFHMFGLKAGILACTVAGATMLPEAVFDVDRVLERVHDERVSVLPGPPTLYQSILDHPGRDNGRLETLRVAVTGAADIPVELVRRIREELPFSVVITGYGLTEAGTATATSPDDDAETVATTVGRARPGFEMRLVDAQGNEVTAGETGEVVLRGGSVMAGYLDDAEATAAVFIGDRWLRTGDLGVLDASGCLRIVGRSKDMFIVGGFNVYPVEVENYLLEHPAVNQVAVVGTHDERMGEVGVAFVVRALGASVSEPELVEWARNRMANYKAPRSIEFVAELPLNATGKVQKESLKERASELRSRASS